MQHLFPFMHSNKRPLASIHINTATKMIILVVLNLDQNTINHLRSRHLNRVLTSSTGSINSTTTALTVTRPLIPLHNRPPAPSHLNLLGHNHSLNARRHRILLSPRQGIDINLVVASKETHDND